MCWCAKCLTIRLHFRTCTVCVCLFWCAYVCVCVFFGLTILCPLQWCMLSLGTERLRDLWLIVFYAAQMATPRPLLRHCSLSVFHLSSWLGGFLLPPVVWNNRDGKSLVYFLPRTGFHQGPLLLFWVRTRPLMWFPFVSDVFWLMLSNQRPFVSW